MNSILKLESVLNTRQKRDKKLYETFNNMFQVSSTTGYMKIPYTYKKNVLKLFGKRDDYGNIIETEEEVIKKIESQQIVKIYNKWSGRGSLFNSLRASRPGVKDEANLKEKVNKYIKVSEKECEFCNPEKNTPKDVFGRIKGKYSITGSNIAKYDAWSSIVFFRRHNPLEFSSEELSDYIDTGFKWFKKVHNYDKQFKYPFFLWNCLQKAGASQIHGHAQILMTNGSYYAKPQFLRKVSKDYLKSTGKNYFKDLYKAHSAIDLVLNSDINGFTSITPIKEKEFVIITEDSPSKSESLKKSIYRILRCYIDKLGVTSFNLVISCPAFGESNFPYIVQIVDRGSIFKTTADIGAMELYGSSVISDDPYSVIKALNNYEITA